MYSWKFCSCSLAFALYLSLHIMPQYSLISPKSILLLGLGCWWCFSLSYLFGFFWLIFHFYFNFPPCFKLLCAVIHPFQKQDSEVIPFVAILLSHWFFFLFSSTYTLCAYVGHSGLFSAVFYVPLLCSASLLEYMNPLVFNPLPIPLYFCFYFI